VDAFARGSVTFYCNHHGTGIINPLPSKGVNIGLFHQDIQSKSMLLDAKANYGQDIYKHKAVSLDGTDLVFEGYQYVFLGHAHWNYGKWVYTHPVTGSKTVVYNLASLLRTNHREVNDNFLERMIPAVFIENGEFAGIEDNIVVLPSRAETVREDRVVAEQAKRLIQKEKKEAKEIMNMHDDPIENLRSEFEDEEGAIYSFLFEHSVNRNLTEIEELILRGEKLSGKI